MKLKIKKKIKQTVILTVYFILIFKIKETVKKEINTLKCFNFFLIKGGCGNPFSLYNVIILMYCVLKLFLKTFNINIVLEQF